MSERIYSPEFLKNRKSVCVGEVCRLHCGAGRRRDVNVFTIPCSYNPGWCRSHPTVSEMTYNVSSGTLNLAQPKTLFWGACVATSVIVPATRNNSVQTASLQCFDVVSQSCSFVDLDQI